MKLFSFLFICLSILACNTRQNDKKNTEENVPETKENSGTQCYLYTSAFDTILLNITQTNENVTGTLLYKLKEKDSNTGTIQGTIKDSIILADYTFMSEGINSVRQVAFKIEDDNLLEGYGEVMNDNDKTKFKNPDSLIFSSSLKIAKTTCP